MVYFQTVVFKWLRLQSAVPIRPNIIRTVQKGRHSSVGKASDGKPSAIVTQVRFPSEAKGASPRVNIRCRLSYGVRAYNIGVRIAYIIICTNLTNLKHCQTYYFVWTHENTAYTHRNRQRCSFGSCCLTQVRRPEFLAWD